MIIDIHLNTTQIISGTQPLYYWFKPIQADDTEMFDQKHLKKLVSTLITKSPDILGDAVACKVASNIINGVVRRGIAHCVSLTKDGRRETKLIKQSLANIRNK